MKNTHLLRNQFLEFKNQIIFFLAITAPAFSTDQNSRGKKIKVTTDCLKKDEWKQFRKSNSSKHDKSITDKFDVR